MASRNHKVARQPEEVKQPSQFRLRTLEELEEASASRRDRIPAPLEASMLRTAVNLIIEAGDKLKMDMIAVATAIVFLRRFYALKSLLKNDRFLMSVACLYLAGKVEDCPKSARDVMWACFNYRYRAHPEALRRFADKSFTESMRERLFVAERALLYALGFDFNVSHPYHHFMALMSTELKPFLEALGEQNPQLRRDFSQFAYTLVNDSYKTPLCLQHGPRDIAAACIWVCAKLLKLDAHQGLGLEPSWWGSLGIRAADLEDIASHLLALYQPGGGADVVGDPSFMLVSARLVSGAKPREAGAAPTQQQQQAQQAVAAPSVTPPPAAAAAPTAEKPPLAEAARRAAEPAAKAVAGMEIDDLDQILEEIYA